MFLDSQCRLPFPLRIAFLPKAIKPRPYSFNAAHKQRLARDFYFTSPVKFKTDVGLWHGIQCQSG